LDVFCASPKLGNCEPEELPVAFVVGGGPKLSPKPGKSGSFSSSSSSHDLALVEVLLPHADMIVLLNSVCDEVFVVDVDVVKACEQSLCLMLFLRVSVCEIFGVVENFFSEEKCSLVGFER